jgi:hypothetical protein
LSAFTHLWNPIGFPGFHPDEGHYMRRTMAVLSGAGPQDTRRDFVSDYNNTYDHPYFGQILLAGLLASIGYPNSLHPVADSLSIERLFLIPRILIGLLSVLDTFIIYMIAQRRYGRYAALFSSLLFAVMPMTWIFRRIYLDNLLMPFFLSSILFAVYAKKLDHEESYIFKLKSENILILFSGFLLGLAIYTKVPAFTMIPLVGFLIYSNSGRNVKKLLFWLSPVILLPLLWPVNALFVGEFNLWLDSVYNQQHRTTFNGFYNTFRDFWIIDPILFLFSIAGLVFAIIKRDLFVLLGLIPYLIFVYLIGWFPYYHLILILPIFCIGAGAMLQDVLGRVKNKQTLRFVPYVIIFGVSLFGLVNSALLVTTSLNMNTAYIQAMTALVKQLNKEDNLNDDSDAKENVLIVGRNTYSWIPQYVFHREFDTLSRFNFFTTRTNDTENIEVKKIILIEDSYSGKRMYHDRPLKVLYNSTEELGNPQSQYDINKYPYSSLKSKFNSHYGNEIIVRTN